MDSKIRQLAKVQQDSSATATTQTAKGNVVVTSASQISPHLDEQQVRTLNTESTHTVNLADRMVIEEYANEFEDFRYAMMKASTRKAKIKNANVYLPITTKAEVVAATGTFNSSIDELTPEEIQKITSDAERMEVNNYRVKPTEPTSNSVRGKDRTSWAKIQGMLNNHIGPNELYDDGANEYELTAYSLTMFMLPESAIFNEKLNDVAGAIKTPKQLADTGGVIIAQTAGSDEFYIEELEFESILGGPGTIANTFNFSIRSPFQADFVDHIFKAAQFLGIRNHNDIPMFLLINWNGRDATTSKAHAFTTSRCIPFRVINMALTYDDSGGTYEVSAARYQEHNLNSVYASLQKDTTIKGETVQEMVVELLSQARTAFSNTIDNVILPDEYIVEMSKDLAAMELVTDKQKQKSDPKQNSNDLTEFGKSVRDKYAVRAPIEPALLSANASPVTRTSSTQMQNRSAFVKTATYAKGKDITAILRDIVESTKLYQEMLTAMEAQADDAQQKRSDPEEIKRYIIGFDSETEIFGYDGNRKKYACRRRYICRMRLDPSLAKDDDATSQSKDLSSVRLYKMLDAGLIKRAYPYYWSGLNTEVKGLDFKFDNHWINAVTLFSKMGGVAKRTTGINADKILGAGQTGAAWNMVRDIYENPMIAAQGAIDELDKDLNKVRGTRRAGGAAFHAKQVAELEAKKKLLEKQKKKLEQQQDTAAARELARITGKLTVLTEELAAVDPTHVAMGTGHTTYAENIPKFTDGLKYLGDMKKLDQEGVLFPVPQVASSLPKISSGMREDYDRGYNILSEIVAKHEGGDMIEIDLEIRGDPYWIPATWHLPNDDTVSPVFQQPYLIVLASSVNDYNAGGIFQVNERSSINAIYRVILVQNRFSGGEFVQSLKCYRDLSVEINQILRKPDDYKHVKDLLDEYGPRGEFG